MLLKLVETLTEGMKVRALRNSCRDHLTNHRDHIGILRQARWYFKYYRHARQAQYRLYLLYNDKNSPVGYGALSLQAGKLFITECVGTQYRGMGHGSLILDRLAQIGLAEGRDMIAEIWATNQQSIALHEKAGFKLKSSTTKHNKELRRYLLSVEDGVDRAKSIKAGQSREVA
jgi:ribosomal protein S18 acetylase RimI-like enzyme